MDLIERFIRYVKVDTESSPTSLTAPSTSKQMDLARMLVSDLKELAVEDVVLTDKGIVYAFIEGNTDHSTPRLGLIAHMDTSPDMSGKNVNPRVIEHYDGGTIVLNQEHHISMNPKDFPALQGVVGHDLIVTDGLTLLGADDKAGVAEIMDVISEIMRHPEWKHGPLSIAFTPDEEVGRGTENFDVDFFKADFAYTIDGGEVNAIDYENFNAASATVTVNGLSIHPGSAKHKMKNSLLLAMEFQQLLPVFDNPAITEGYEGFNHLTTMNGDCEKTTMNYIIRNHDEALLQKQKSDFENARDFMNRKYGEGTIQLEIQDAYKNMRSYIEEKMFIVDIAKEAIAQCGLTPVSTAIRGGTDGASLTYMGLPCPNLGTGGRQCHGKFEFASIQEMRKVSEILQLIIQKVAQA